MFIQKLVILFILLFVTETCAAIYEVNDNNIRWYTLKRKLTQLYGIVELFDLLTMAKYIRSF